MDAEGSDHQVVIAVHDPSVFQPIDDLIKLLGIREFKLVLSPRTVILSAITLSYDRNLDSDEDLVQTLEDDSSAQIQDLEVTADLLDDTSEAPIIRLVNQIITRSIRARASDIHIEPYQDSLKIRYRVDGILYDLLTPPKWMQPALISRIKVMSRLDIAEKRLPQDGRLNIRIGRPGNRYPGFNHSHGLRGAGGAAAFKQIRITADIDRARAFHRRSESFWKK